MAKRPKRIKGYYYNLPDGKGPRPSVTHVIQTVLAKGEGFLRWYASKGWELAQREGKEAASFGSAMHKIVAKYLRSGTVPKSDSKDIMQAWDLWFDWYIKNRPKRKCKGEGVEKLVYSNEYAGTYDWFDGTTLFDWKFGRGIYEGYRIQAGAYVHLLNAERALIVRFDRKKKNTEVLEMGQKELDEAYEIFEYLLRVFNWKNENK